MILIPNYESTNLKFNIMHLSMVSPSKGGSVVLGQAEVDTGRFSGHSTRCASTSKAILSVSTDVILAPAGWTEESTFRKFYNKPVAVTNQMSFAVLN